MDPRTIIPADPCPMCGSDAINPDCTACMQQGQPIETGYDGENAWAPDPRLANDPNEPESQDGPSRFTPGTP